MMSKCFLKLFLLYGFIVFVLFASWDMNRSSVALAVGDIPEESIRLRILAHSNSAQDQWIKRKIRDEIVQFMDDWVDQPDNIEEAKSEIARRLDEFEELVKKVLAENGVNQSVEITLGTVPFPPKLYGGKVYPGGDYEALRVTLGEGKGNNWWCVLFPPLCFVDMASGETAAAAEIPDGEISAEQNADSGDQEAGNGDVEVKFFLWEIIEWIINFIRGLFGF